jgi:hypothetical protein
MANALNKIRINKIIIILFVFAFILRLIAGPGWGLPFRYDPDEAFFIQPSIDMYRSKNFNPGWFGHPGSTIIYINMIAYVLLSKFHIIFGEFQSAGAVLEFLKKDPSTLLYLMRFIQVIIGSLTVVMVYVVGRKLLNHWAGVIAALMVSVVPLMINYSQIVRTDMLAALLMLIVIDRSIEVMKHGHFIDYVLSSLAIAAAIATKYPAGLISLYLVWCHFARGAGLKQSWKIVLACIMSFGFIFIFSPFMFLDYKAVIRDLVSESIPHYVGAKSEGVLLNFWWYTKLLVIDSMGFFSILYVVGLWHLFKERRYNILGIALFVIVFLLAISMQNVRWERWLVPVIPMAILTSIVGMEFLFKKLNSYKSSKLLKIILLLFLTLPIAAKGGAQIYHRSGVDTRTQAAEWIVKNIPPGKNLIVEVYGPQLPSNIYNFYMIVNGSPKLRGVTTGYVMPARTVGGLYDFALLRDQSIDFLVVTNLYDRYKLNPGENKIVIENYENIFKKSFLVKEFLPSGGSDIHPFKVNVSGGLPIRIYQINKN